MKISQKLIVVLFGVVMLIGVVGYMQFQITQKTLQEQIGREAVNFSRRIMSEIDKEIYFRLEKMQVDAKIFSLAREASISTEEFNLIISKESI